MDRDSSWCRVRVIVDWRLLLTLGAVIKLLRSFHVF